MAYPIEQWLLRYGQAVAELKAKEPAYRAKRGDILSARIANYDFDYQGGTPYYDNSAMDRKMSQLQDIEERLEEERVRVATLKGITEAAIAVLNYSDSPVRTEILRLRYVQLLDFQAISKRVFYGDDIREYSRIRKVRRYHDRGLQTLQRMLPTEAHYNAAAGILHQMAPRQSQETPKHKGIYRDTRTRK